jgi:hypothetical protein
MKKFFTITLLIILLNQINAQQEFLGNWGSNGIATDISVSIVENKINVSSVSSVSGNPLQTTDVRYNKNKLYLKNNYVPNNWKTNVVFVVKDKKTLIASIVNMNGVFEIEYVKKE